MSGQLRTHKGTDFFTTEELQKRLADDKRAEINFKNREEQKNAAKQIGFEHQALAAGKSSAAGKRIERV